MEFAWLSEIQIVCISFKQSIHVFYVIQIYILQEKRNFSCNFITFDISPTNKERDGMT